MEKKMKFRMEILNKKFLIINGVVLKNIYSVSLIVSNENVFLVLNHLEKYCDSHTNRMTAMQTNTIFQID